MTPVRRAVLAAVVACTALLVAGVPGGDSALPEHDLPVRALVLRPIAAQPANRAAVVVDKGDGAAPVKVCVRFDAATITGEEALRLAAEQEPALDPVFSDFSGMGKAVCALCGIGCPSGDCFCDPDRYWAYSRAEAGSAAFRTSPVGVSSSQVTDGDVEGYRWGSGASPDLPDIRTICGEVLAPAPTTAAPPPPLPPAIPAPPAPAPPAPPPARDVAPTSGAPTAPRQPTTTVLVEPVPTTSPGGSTTTTGAGGGEPPTTSGSGDPTTTTAPSVVAPSTSTTSDGPHDDEATGPDDEATDDDEVASVRLTQGGETGGGGSGLALAGVGATFLALVGGAVALQRARRPA